MIEALPILTKMNGSTYSGGQDAHDMSEGNLLIIQEVVMVMELGMSFALCVFDDWQENLDPFENGGLWQIYQMTLANQAVTVGLSRRRMAQATSNGGFAKC